MNFLNLISNSNSILNFKLSSNHTPPSTIPPHPNDSSAFSKVPATELSLLLKSENSQQNLSMDQIMQQRQKLINQYLQLNIQMLEKEINQKEKITETAPTSLPQQKDQEEEERIEPESNKKKIKKINRCGHEDKPHYAKGMCNNCYHKFGRVKKPWRCSHDKLYAGGMCQNCYINDYNRKRREQASKNQERSSGEIVLENEVGSSDQ